MYTRVPLPLYVEAVYDVPFGHSQGLTKVRQSGDLSPEENLTLRIWLYVTPILLLTGTLGSLVSISVLLRPNIRKSTPMYFLTLLSFTDVIALWLGLLRLYINYVHGYDVRDTSNISCKLHTFFVYFTLDLGSWLLALIAIERFLFIVCPHTAKLQWNRTRGTYAVILVSIILTLVNGHYIFTTYLHLSLRNDTLVTDINPPIDNGILTSTVDIIYPIASNPNIFSEESSTTRVRFDEPTAVTNGYNGANNSHVRIGFADKAQSCENQPGSEEFHNKIFPWIDFAAFFFLPFCVMVITHVGIIRHVHLVNVRLKKTPQTTTERAGKTQIESLCTIESLSMKERTKATNTGVKRDEPDSTTDMSKRANNKKTPQTITERVGKIQMESLCSIESLPMKERTKATNTVVKSDDADSTIDVSKRAKNKKSGKRKTQRSKVPGVSLMLFSVLVAFTVTTCPITIYVITTLIQSDAHNQTPEEKAHENFKWVVVNMIQYANNASHFFLFILTGKNFRQELLQMLDDACLHFKRLGAACRKKSNTVEPISSC